MTRLTAALAPIIDNRGRAALRDRIEGAWLRLGGPACVQEPTDLEDVKVYLDLVESMERGGDLEDLAGLEQELLRLFAVPDVQAPDRLQVMTIHKAKGLEFDVVILPGLARASRKDEPELMRWLERPRGEDESDLLLAAITARGSERDPLYACVTRLLDERQEHEDARLLYVAATRARERLHLLAELKVEDQHDQPPSPVKPDERALLSEAVAGAGGRRCGRRSRATPAMRASRQSAPVDPMSYPLRRMPLDWRPASLRRRRWSGSHCLRSKTIAMTTVEFSWAGETARHVGNCRAPVPAADRAGGRAGLERRARRSSRQSSRERPCSSKALRPRSSQVHRSACCAPCATVCGMSVGAGCSATCTAIPAASIGWRVRSTAGS